MSDSFFDDYRVDNEKKGNDGDRVIVETMQTLFNCER